MKFLFILLFILSPLLVSAIESGAWDGISVGGLDDASLVNLTETTPVTLDIVPNDSDPVDDTFSVIDRGGAGGGSVVVPTPSSGSDLVSLIDELISIANKLIAVLVGLAVLVFIWGIIKYLYSAGDAKARQEWRNYMIYGVLAITVIVGFWGIVRAVLNLFGLGFAGPQF